ncbi:CysZ protein [Microbacterium sp. AG1240]|uniref:EI24 domain-containing protein n=1 Tax=Microbacterium sp. AG1240 TaxID=2183992 RepID=UPI000F272835|nr:EI24 domain-containing protein [Microbacterium sp. AG1240]RKT33570.1 CysZ protein [Microbacterium sp. AG1240]
MKQFGAGVGMLARGFGWWRRRPGVMAAGLVPALIVGVVLLAGVITLAVFLPQIATTVTPFADGWPEIWVSVVRFAAGAATLGAALVIAVVSFTALTLLIGEPFYDRIWRSVEEELGEVPDVRYGFARALVDTVWLIARGIGVAILTALLGLVPVVGGAVGAVLGVVLTGWLLTDELTSRALTARGVDRAQRRRLLRARRGQALGFGVATQLCFLVPLGAVAVMPAAVAGSTMLATSLLADAPRSTR